jgi:hypothetical protein
MDQRTRPTGSHDVRYHVDRQTGDQVNNVGGNQYNEYIQHVRQERESFARDIAATKTNARRLVWAGFILSVLGGATFAWAIIRSMAGVQSLMEAPFEEFDSFTQAPSDFFGPELLGVPAGLLGFAVAGLGQVILVVGVVLHIVAASRRRQLQTSFAPPPPGPAPHLGGWGS